MSKSKFRSVQSLSRVWLFATPWIEARQASLSITNSRLLLLLSHFSHVRLCATHRRQPTRLPRPWDSPGKNTGVGCHFLLQCMKLKSESEVAQSCPTLRDPMDCGLPGCSVHGIFQARVLEWGAITFSDMGAGKIQWDNSAKMISTVYPHKKRLRNFSICLGCHKTTSHSEILEDSWEPCMVVLIVQT